MSPKFLLLILLTAGVSVHAWGTVAPVPSESECRPYIEKALKELSTEPTAEAVDTGSTDTPLTTDTPTEDSTQEGSNEETKESVTTDSAEKEEGDKSGDDEEDDSKREDESKEAEHLESVEGESVEAEDQTDSEEGKDEKSEETEAKDNESEEQPDSAEHANDITTESQEAEEGESKNASDEENEASEIKEESQEEESTEDKKSAEDEEHDGESVEQGSQEAADETAEDSAEKSSEAEEKTQDNEDANSKSEESKDETEMITEEEKSEEDTKESSEKMDKSDEEEGESKENDAKDESTEKDDDSESGEKGETASVEDSAEGEDKSAEVSKPDNETEKESTESVEAEDEKEKSDEKVTEASEEDGKDDKSEEDTDSKGEESEEEQTPEEEDLTIDVVIPEKLRSRDHISHILKLDSESEETERLLSKTIDITLRELKRLYDSAIQPLEILYKYRDLSNRHFGDPEIFSKPLILFMGPWSGGKSTIINYLLDNEYATSALRTGAEPSPAYFNILMWGENEEVLDGTQLAADWTFSGLQKFGQGLLDRLRGLKLKSPLLEKVNIVEIPGILEIRKQVERVFPFNDACQWFIDRADIIFLVYDPSKLDVGPETEAILDQLKGREYQTRIILNKADQVKPEELMRVQGTLIWNISPLMSSSEPPVMYSTSLWSIPYEVGSPTRLLFAQEKAFLKDLRDAVDKRVENKIASARRFAVRVRNHAKMVDCYLTTYYNHKSFFGNRKKVADDIIEHPQNYHIYEGLSTLTNISRYDLPDPEVYRDFFRLNPVYDFQKLSSTCTYFRGCPINRLDIAIAYDLPELVGKYKKSAEAVLTSPQAPPKS